LLRIKLTEQDWYGRLGDRPDLVGIDTVA